MNQSKIGFPCFATLWYVCSRTTRKLSLRFEMVIQLWNDWLARRVLSRRTMSLDSLIRTMNNGHVQNWYRWKFEGTVVWASRSSKAIGQSISHALMVFLILLINVCGMGQVRPQEHSWTEIHTHTPEHQLWLLLSLFRHNSRTTRDRWTEANNIRRNSPCTKNELPEKWDLLYGRFQAHGILRWVLYFSFWNNK